MGWPPAVVIVVRHGSRLDAADKQWHLTSPTPYDPPLTYGGWTQSRALGARIASILRSRETDEELPGIEGDIEQDGKHRRKRRHKVIIHTSPFLRCVQTSVAISAGLAQNPGQPRKQPSRSPAAASPALKASQMHSSPRTRPVISTGSPYLAPIPEPNAMPTLSKLDKASHVKKSTLRVDAFLGEWLTPDYFELITPPPSSIMMVAGAKADLLRREDYSNLAFTRDIIGAPGNQPFPGGWGSPVVVAKADMWKEKDEGALSALPSLAQALPRRDRTSSLSSVGSPAGVRNLKDPSNVTEAEHCLYQVPVPNYAISTSDPIPIGYVAHARDYCVDIDYQWDSMRAPQNWGDGGEYGEEWSSMHKRFRKGLQSMVNWYQTTDDPGKLLPKTSGQAGTTPEESQEDEDTDLVIILVTHGAGCNALIGALTNQPVLLDVGMASLTMAVRKPTPASSRTTTPSHSRDSSRAVSVSEQYDVKLVASTDHLRSSSSTPSTSRAASVTSLGVFRDRERLSTKSPYDMNVSSRSPGNNPNFGSIRRAASVAMHTPTRPYEVIQPIRNNSVGLWTPQPVATEPEEEQDNMILNFGYDSGEVTPMPEKFAAPVEEVQPVYHHEHHEAELITPQGLWGFPLPPDEAEKNREQAVKRRWTVTERTL